MKVIRCSSNVCDACDYAEALEWYMEKRSVEESSLLNEFEAMEQSGEMCVYCGTKISASGEKTICESEMCYYNALADVG